MMMMIMMTMMTMMTMMMVCCCSRVPWTVPQWSTLRWRRRLPVSSWLLRCQLCDRYDSQAALQYRLQRTAVNNNIHFGVAAAFQLCSTARHFRDRRRSGPIVTPALILFFCFQPLHPRVFKNINNNNNNYNNYKRWQLIALPLVAACLASCSRL